MDEQFSVPFKYQSRASDFAKAFTKRVGEDLALARDQLISRQNAQRFSHGRNWRTKPMEYSDEEGELNAHSFELVSPFEHVMTHDFRQLLLARRNIVEGLIRELKLSIFEMIHRTTEKTGNIVNSPSKQSPAEAFLAALEMIEFGIDENGEVSLPQIHLGTGAFEGMMESLGAQGPEFIARVERVKAEKSEQARQREQERLGKFPAPWND